MLSCMSGAPLSNPKMVFDLKLSASSVNLVKPSCIVSKDYQQRSGPYSTGNGQRTNLENFKEIDNFAVLRMDARYNSLEIR